MLQNYSVIDEADVFGGVVSLGPLLTQEMQDAGGQHSEFAVFNEFTQVWQPCLFALWVLLNDADDAVHDGPLVLKATLQQRGFNLNKEAALSRNELWDSDPNQVQGQWSKHRTWRQDLALCARSFLCKTKGLNWMLSGAFDVLTVFGLKETFWVLFSSQLWDKRQNGATHAMEVQQTGKEKIFTSLFPFLLFFFYCFICRCCQMVKKHFELIDYKVLSCMLLQINTLYLLLLLNAIH